jgi:hypothetical protein
MIPFKTTPEQVMKLAEIMVAMKKAKLDQSFIVAASDIAREDEGVFDLMDLWLRAAGDHAERDELGADLQDAIDEEADAPATPMKKPYIKFDKLDLVVQKVVEDKERLRQLVERHGGVSAVARKAGIPQPSLSRMLSSASMPRRSTLYKIANALDLSEVDIVTEWSR